MRKKARTTSTLRENLLRARRDNDFTVGVESQRPARRMGRNTLPSFVAERRISICTGGEEPGSIPACVLLQQSPKTQTHLLSPTVASDADRPVFVQNGFRRFAF